MYVFTMLGGGGSQVLTQCDLKDGGISNIQYIRLLSMSRKSWKIDDVTHAVSLSSGLWVCRLGELGIKYQGLY